ncbi:complement C1q tumor necrosis factor-related protein 2-like [Mercenaria mercenaria]|uniref:complement C1q tumor necrosis factor-related protein 2-like n=1 Tax=Mercenaria mercenaria TaxID=6596 RepID=UPI00234F5A37|nr:complement C1q tumor necrosis factor-related protein 2-like [Mercenaria mercenaria]
MDVLYVLFIISICALQFSKSVESEQFCSKFPYAEQTLERMLRVEAKVDQWDKEMKRFEEAILSVLEHRRDKTDKQLQKLRDEIEKMQDGRMRNQFIAFNAYTKVSGKYPIGEAVIFPEVLLNEGGGYNSTTGHFTAPVAGLYHFTAHVCNQDTKAMVISIKHGTNTIAVGTEYEDNNSSCSSLSAPALMKAGESVYVKSTYEHNYMQFNVYRQPSFMGVLVQSRQ